jgi:Uma2 family endonuclease
VAEGKIMTTLPARSVRPPARGASGKPILPLEQGDHLDQQTFHERYEAMPKGTKAELIGGIVFMPSPLKQPHGEMHALVITWLGIYKWSTPGTRLFDNATTILDDRNEPQPDVCLLISASGKGQTRDQDEFIAGPPELIAEVAASSASIDLHRKRDEYEKVGVKEYLVVDLSDWKMHWWVLRNSCYEDLLQGTDGILRSEAFPGLWLDPEALLRLDTQRVSAVLQQGIASPEHATFVQWLTTP